MMQAWLPAGVHQDANERREARNVFRGGLEANVDPSKLRCNFQPWVTGCRFSKSTRTQICVPIWSKWEDWLPYVYGANDPSTSNGSISTENGKVSFIHMEEMVDGAHIVLHKPMQYYVVFPAHVDKSLPNHLCPWVTSLAILSIWWITRLCVFGNCIGHH